MKSINNVILQKRKDAMMLSKKISEKNNIFKDSLEVKIKKSKMGVTSSTIIILIAAILYVANIPNLASGLLIAGVLSLFVNLAMLNYFKKK